MDPDALTTALDDLEAAITGVRFGIDNRDAQSADEACEHAEIVFYDLRAAVEQAIEATLANQTATNQPIKPQKTQKTT